MKLGKELTVEVDLTLKELQETLKKQKFEIIKEYDINDIYMFEWDCDFNRDPLDILSNCLLVRNIVLKDEVVNVITYKQKEYNEAAEIIKEGKVDCYIHSIEQAEHLLNILGYRRYFEIKDHMIIYSNGKTEFAVQIVNDDRIYIELEDECKRINKHYDTIEEMKLEINSLNVPIKDNNYYANKAKDELIKFLENKTAN